MHTFSWGKSGAAPARTYVPNIYNKSHTMWLIIDMSRRMRTNKPPYYHILITPEMSILTAQYRNGREGIPRGTALGHLCSRCHTNDKCLAACLFSPPTSQFNNTNTGRYKSGWDRIFLAEERILDSNLLHVEKLIIWNSTLVICIIRADCLLQ